MRVMKLRKKLTAYVKSFVFYSLKVLKIKMTKRKEKKINTIRF